MGLTLQRKLELAGDLARVQPFLQRLHLVEKPKERHPVRNAILVISAIVAVGAAVAVVLRRLDCQRSADTGSEESGQTDLPSESSPETQFDFEAAVREPTAGTSG